MPIKTKGRLIDFQAFLNQANAKYSTGILSMFSANTFGLVTTFKASFGWLYFKLLNMENTDYYTSQIY